MRPPEDDGAEQQPPRRKKAKLAQPRRLPFRSERRHTGPRDKASHGERRRAEVLDRAHGAQPGIASGHPRQKKSSMQNDPAEHQPLQMPFPEVPDSIS